MGIYISPNLPGRRQQIIERKVVNMDQSWSGEDYAHYIHCGWDDCEKVGYECYKVKIHTERPGYPERIVNFVFCSERHRQYFINSSQQAQGGFAPEFMHGMLPKGYKKII